MDKPEMGNSYLLRGETTLKSATLLLFPNSHGGAMPKSPNSLIFL
tara:strand:+ start:13722 stop:13856 length:135 start_codon:yes stop_codon:yes gene_type:complete